MKCNAFVPRLISRNAFIPAMVVSSVVASPILSVVMPAIAQTFGDVVRERKEERIVAQVNPNRPVQIEVINAGSIPITCILTQPASAERVVPPGGTMTFGSTRTSYLPLPINFLAYPQESLIGLNSSVFVEDNVVTIVIGAQLSDSSGDIAVNITENGSVYLF